MEIADPTLNTIHCSVVSLFIFMFGRLSTGMCMLAVKVYIYIQKYGLRNVPDIQGWAHFTHYMYLSFTENVYCYTLCSLSLARVLMRALLCLFNTRITEYLINLIQWQDIRHLHQHELIR